MSHDDFAVEPIPGLPEKLPADEYIIWQGSPDHNALAREALSLRWVAGYFVLLTIWRVGASSADYPLGVSVMHGVPFVIAGLVACGLLYLIAYVQARATIYTLTNKRVAMRIGAALTMTLNLPYTWIGTAKLDLRSGGTGTLAFELIGDTRVSYLMTWPHVRPWYMSRTQPALRCIPDAENVARMFATAAETRISQPIVARVQPDGGNAVAAE
ncbi:photosynthetic complex putative assembly protein PuhB [Yoonia vestfoldensis]|uniref:photosynthetic complex putative assembly protein PuhB n=1 Tax=Yoonia vestfoldensis TaxID=245188 RepID=UPI000368A4A9|nr:photosynthetic complex putative assembly protein PuhB [Yoonia vestfoldensis]